MVFDGTSGMFLDQFFEPFTGVFARCHVLVLASVVNVLCDAHMVGGIANDGKHGFIGI